MLLIRSAKMLDDGWPWQDELNELNQAAKTISVEQNVTPRSNKDWNTKERKR